MTRKRCDICGRKMPRKKGYVAVNFSKVNRYMLFNECPRCDKQLGELFEFQNSIENARRRNIAIVCESLNRMGKKSEDNTEVTE